MAVTSVWSIKSKLKISINYVTNPEKTLNEDYGNEDYSFYELNKKHDYNFKKEKAEYVSGINCSDTGIYVYDEFMDTKQFHDKENGILAFHGYQSFKEGEVTANIAHEVGVKLAKEMWGDRFEVLVATHQNTNHFHNHFIINSVSFKDGLKYNHTNKNIAKIRQISDAICEEYGLSTIDKYKYKKHSKYDYINQQKILNEPYYKMIKEDIDTTIKDSITMKQLVYKLRQQDYRYYFKNNKLTVWKDGCDRVRLEKAFGENYSTEKIKSRFGNFADYKQYKPISARSYFENWLLKTSAPHGIYRLYLYYCYLLKVFPTEQPVQRLSYAIRKDIAKLDEISKQSEFLVENKIVTYEDFKAFKDSNNYELAVLRNDKENVQKRFRRATNEDKKADIQEEINSITSKIKELANYKYYCDGIEKRSGIIETNIDEFHNSDLTKDKVLNR